MNWPEAIWRTLRLASSNWGRTARLVLQFGFVI